MQPVGEVVSGVYRDVPFASNEEEVHISECVEEFMNGVFFILRFSEIDPFQQVLYEEE